MTTLGNAIAKTAIQALRLPQYTKVPGECEKFVREVCEDVEGVPAEAITCFLGSAALSMKAFYGTRFDVWKAVGFPDESAPVGFLQAGDILYKGDATSGAEGHTGIVFHNIGPAGITQLCVAENSSYHTDPLHDGNVSGAKGFRTLREFGYYEMVVRLSEAK